MTDTKHQRVIVPRATDGLPRWMRIVVRITRYAINGLTVILLLGAIAGFVITFGPGGPRSGGTVYFVQGRGMFLQFHVTHSWIMMGFRPGRAGSIRVSTTEIHGGGGRLRFQDWLGSLTPQVSFQAEQHRSSKYWDYLGFSYRHTTFPVNYTRKVSNRKINTQWITWRVPGIRVINLSAIFALLVVLRIGVAAETWRRRRRYRRRLRAGCCPKCAYELGATSCRCPECGWGETSVAPAEPEE